MRNALLLPLLLITAAAPGQDSPADRVAGFLTADVIAVARIDVQDVNVDAAFDRLAPFLSFSGKDDGADRQSAKAAVEGLRKAGAREVFVIVAPTDFPRGQPALAVTTADVADPKAIANLLGVPEPTTDSDRTVMVRSGAIYIGSKATFDRLKEGHSNGRPELAAAFAAVSESPVQFVLSPSEDHRRVLREMLPDPPADFGGVTGEQIAAGLRWAAFGVSFEPKLSAKLVIETESEQAAESLNVAFAAGLRRLSTAPEVLQTFPAMPLFVGSLLPKREGARLVLVPDEAIQTAAKLLGDLVGAARRQAGQSQGLNNLKQIGLAFHNFADTYGSFPPSAGYAGDTPLLSWRVYLLPFLGQQPLYQQFRLDEPWDSEHNRELIEKMPAVFRAPNVATPPGYTPYVVPTGDGLLFGGRTGIPFQQITDGTSNTVLAIETTAEKAVPWTKPGDLAIDPKNPLAGLLGGSERFAVLFADGSVRTFSGKIDPQRFLKLLTPAGGEPIDSNTLDSP